VVKNEEDLIEEEVSSEPIFEIDQEDSEGEERTIFLLEDDEDEADAAAPVNNQPEPKVSESESEVEANQRQEATTRYSLDDYTELESRLRTAKPEATRENPAEIKADELTAQEEDEALQFEVRKLESRTGGESSDGDASPMEHTIEESMRMRVEERKAKLKAFNYRFRNHPYSIDEVSNEPAYKRQGVKIEDTKYSEDSRAGRFTIEDGDGGSDIKTNNTFLHDNVD
jgi:cell division protein FtsZ